MAGAASALGDDGGRGGAGRRLACAGLDRVPRRARVRARRRARASCGGRGARLPARPAGPAPRQHPQSHLRRGVRAAPRLPRRASSRRSTARSTDTGYDLALGADRADAATSARAVRSLLEFRCEAVVLLGPTLPRSDIEELARGCRWSSWRGPCGRGSVDVVRTDDRAGGRLAVEHLVAPRARAHRPRRRHPRSRRRGAASRLPRRHDRPRPGPQRPAPARRARRGRRRARRRAPCCAGGRRPR